MPSLSPSSLFLYVVLLFIQSASGNTLAKQNFLNPLETEAKMD
jgi:hypothetical protein